MQARVYHPQLHPFCHFSAFTKRFLFFNSTDPMEFVSSSARFDNRFFFFLIANSKKLCVSIYTSALPFDAQNEIFKSDILVRYFKANLIAGFLKKNLVFYHNNPLFGLKFLLFFCINRFRLFISVIHTVLSTR